MSETVFTYAAPALELGPAASAEVGHDLLSCGARRVLLVTDAGVAATGAMQQQRLLATAPRRPRGGPRVRLQGVDGTLVTCRPPAPTCWTSCADGGSPTSTTRR